MSAGIAIESATPRSSTHSRTVPGAATTLIDVNADFTGMGGWNAVVNANRPGYTTVTSVISATKVTLAGVWNTVANLLDDRYYLSSPPGVAGYNVGTAYSTTGSLADARDYAQRSSASPGTSYLWAGYRYVPPLAGVYVDPETGPLGIYGRQPGNNLLGQYYCHHRVYDILTARWTSPDPAASPWTNLNGYVRNPIQMRDPSGLDQLSNAADAVRRAAEPVKNAPPPPPKVPCKKVILFGSDQSDSGYPARKDGDLVRIAMWREETLEGLISTIDAVANRPNGPHCCINELTIAAHGCLWDKRGGFHFRGIVEDPSNSQLPAGDKFSKGTACTAKKYVLEDSLAEEKRKAGWHHSNMISMTDFGNALRKVLCSPCTIRLKVCNQEGTAAADQLAAATGCKVEALHVESQTDETWEEAVKRQEYEDAKRQAELDVMEKCRGG